MYRIIEPDPQQWDAFVRQHPRAHLLQQSAWGKLKLAYGWQVSRVALTPDDRSEVVAGAQVLYRNLSRLGSMAYVPMGPLVSASDQWTPLWNTLHKRASQRKAAFLKWEPGLYLRDTPPDFAKWGFAASPQTVQPPRTVLID
ncbi:MAG: aminoacyltransferase, partial [Anaerolineae bacterium]|nr:aminoacyltransferase [Anaerolineae bacterium]